jgi:hypothetical protein
MVVSSHRRSLEGGLVLQAVFRKWFRYTDTIFRVWSGYTDMVLEGGLVLQAVF